MRGSNMLGGCVGCAHIDIYVHWFIQVGLLCICARSAYDMHFDEVVKHVQFEQISSQHANRHQTCYLTNSSVEANIFFYHIYTIACLYWLISFRWRYFLRFQIHRNARLGFVITIRRANLGLKTDFRFFYFYAVCDRKQEYNQKLAHRSQHPNHHDCQHTLPDHPIASYLLHHWVDGHWMYKMNCLKCTKTAYQVQNSHATDDLALPRRWTTA